MLKENSSRKITQPFLFSVEKNGVRSFLFGTIHSGISLSDLPPTVTSALLRSEIAFSENTPTKPVEKEKQPLVHRPYPSEKAVAVLRKRGIPEYLFTSPMICSFYYTWDLDKDKFYLDSELKEMAVEFGKPLYSLDDTSDLAEIAKRGDAADEKCDIEETVKYLSPEETSISNQRYLASYRTGDLRTVTPCDGHCMERTLRWAKKLTTEERSFFAFVGVAHLPGASGLIELLLKQGYAVKQVTGRKLD